MVSFFDATPTVSLPGDANVELAFSLHVRGRWDLVGRFLLKQQIET